MAGFSELRNTINPNLSLPSSLEQSSSPKKRHVSFSETCVRHRYKQPEDPKPSPTPSRSMCWIWTWLGILTLLLLSLTVVLTSYTLFPSALPQIRITKLSFPKLEVADSSRQKFLNAYTSLSIEFTNMNDRIGLKFGSLTIDISSQLVKFGQSKVEGFSLRTGNVTTLDVFIASVSDSKAGIPIPGQLKPYFNNHVMTVDVFLSAKLIFYLGGLRMCGLPMEATCNNVKQADHKDGRPSLCSVKLLGFW